MANTSGRKYGGRKQGIPNRATGDLRSWLFTFLQHRVEQIESDWNSLAPSQRLAYFEKLLKFCLPPLQSEQATTFFDKFSNEELQEIIQKLVNTSQHE